MPKKNDIYGFLETQYGALVLDTNFVKDQIISHQQAGGAKDDLNYALIALFENPKILWVKPKSEYWAIAKEFWED